jgi:hypothetical protein
MFEGKIPLRQGKYFNTTFTLSGSDAPSIAGLAVRAQIRDEIDGNIMASFTSEGGSPNAFVDATNKIVTLELNSTVTAAIAGPAEIVTWVMDVELYNAGTGLVLVDLSSYYIEWQPEVTK